jgi:oxygen-dependent protoporphyrinogen oxidase
MTRVAVVGGGISGLAAAWSVAARDPAAEVVVLEGTADIGGKLRVACVGGVAVDVGAEAILTARPEAVRLIDELGLTQERVAPLTTSAAVYAGGFRHPLPAGTMLGVPGSVQAARASGLFTAAALAAIEAEPQLAPLPPLDGDVAVGRLVRDRLGDEVTDRLVEPLLGGVYAGRADELSLRATMPALAAALAEGGSLVQAAASVADRGTRASGPVFTSLVGGVGRLPRELAAAGRFTVRTATMVRALRRTPTGFALDCGPVPAPSLVTADAVVLAVPPAKAARLLDSVAPAAAAELAAIESANVAIVTFALRDVDLPPGSGLLVALGERLAVKGVTLSSQKWPLETGGLVLLRASLGRAGESAVLQRSDEELIALVRGELRALLGVTAEPVDALVTRWGGGLPQYGVGHVERVRRIRDAVAAVPGLAVCGAAFDGVGIPACIAAAGAAAEQVASRLGQ